MTSITRDQRLHVFETNVPGNCMHCGLDKDNALHMPTRYPDLPDQTRIGERYASWDDIYARGRALALDPGAGTFDEALTTRVARLLEPLTPARVGMFMYQRPTYGWGYYDEYMVRNAEEQARKIVANFPLNDATHWDTAALVSTNPERYQHFYGYARGIGELRDTWVLHSWAYDINTKSIIELTGRRRAQYVGAAFPLRMALDFGIDIGAYTNEQRTRLLSMGHGGRIL